MPARPLAVLVLAVACAFGSVGSAEATIFQQARWNVFITGKQTVRWSFSADQPEACTAYYGTASQAAKGSGTVKLTFGTAKKRPLTADASVFGGKLRFNWDSLGEHRIPATWSKQGSFMVANGKPCGSAAADPEPLPKFADTSGCGTQKAELIVFAAWRAGKLIVKGAPDGVRGAEECPGVFEEAMHVDWENDRCTPGSRVDGTDGSDLQELHTPLPRAKLLGSKAFTVKAQHEYDCDFPAAIWPGKPVLQADLVTSYEMTFRPRGR